MSFVREYARGFSLIELLFAISLGSFICMGVFNLCVGLRRLSQREEVISHFAENTRFLSLFLRGKVNEAGDWSCATKNPGSLSLPVKGFDSDDAKDKLGLTIKSGTDLLQLRECVRFHHKMVYLPIDFFVANTYRVDQSHHAIYALFYKVTHHPREELITGMTQFQLSFGVRDQSRHNIRAYHRVDYVTDWKKVGAVKIRYSFFNDHFLLHQSGVLYAGLWAQK